MAYTTSCGDVKKPVGIGLDTPTTGHKSSAAKKAMASGSFNIGLFSDINRYCAPYVVLLPKTDLTNKACLGSLFYHYATRSASFEASTLALNSAISSRAASDSSGSVKLGGGNFSMFNVVSEAFIAGRIFVRLNNFPTLISEAVLAIVQNIIELFENKHLGLRSCC